MTSASSRRATSLIFAFTAVALPVTARATVVWTAGFESDMSGDVCATAAAGAEFTPGAIVVNGTRIDAQVLGEQVYSGKLACKVTVHPDDIFKSYNQNRVDVKHNSTLTGEGKDMYLSGYYYLPEDAKTRNEFGMFEATNSLNWMDIWIEPKTGGGTAIKLGIESNGANLGSVLVWTGDFSTRTWHQIGIHVHWSQDATKGLVDFWLDGKQVVTGFKHKTKPNQYDLYYLTGLHRVLMQPYTESIYFDDFIEADTQADIKIGTPMIVTDAGVTADAGGGAGAPGGIGDAAGDGSQDAGGTGAGTGTGGTFGEDGGAGSASNAGAAGSSAGAGGGIGGIGATGGAGMNGSGAAGMATSSPRRVGSSGCSIAESSAPLNLCLIAGAPLVAILLRRRHSRIQP